jgi:hypothetical protein
MSQAVLRPFLRDVMTLALWIGVLLTLGIAAGSLAFAILGVDRALATFVLMVGLGMLVMLVRNRR